MNVEQTREPVILLSFLGKIGFLYPIFVKILFEIVYITQYHHYWEYLGVKYEPNFTKAVISWVVAVVFVILGQLCAEDKLGKIFGIFLNVSIIPSLSILWLKNERIDAFLLIVTYWFVWWVITIAFSITRPLCLGLKPNYEKGEDGMFIPSSSNLIVILIYSWVILTTLYLSAKYGGMRLFVDIDNVYAYRLSGVSMSSLESYIFAWNTNALLPLLFGVHFTQRKALLFFGDIIMTLLSYGIFGNKSMLFMIPLVFGVILLSELNVIKHVDKMIGLFIILYLLISVVTSNQMFIALGDRILEGPATGHYNYYDFFSSENNPLLYLRESILRSFMNSPYNDSVSRIIGSSSKYYSGAYNNMNNGLFSVAFANFGIVGVIIQPLVIVGTFYLFCKLIRDFDETIQYILILLHILYLISTTYFSWLMTGGLIVEAFALYAIRYFDGIRIKTNKVSI